MDHSTTKKKKPIGRFLAMGTLSVAMYAVLLQRQDMFNEYCAIGGLFALLPIGMAFAFSFIHGSFTGDFWTILGIEASKKKGGK